MDNREQHPQPTHPQPEHTQSPDVREGRIPVPGGEVWYKIVGASKPGIPLLTLHGGPGYPSPDLVTLEQLATDRPIIFYDQLGCGKSKLPGQDKKPEEEGYQDYSKLWTIDRFVEELAAVREHIGRELGVNEMHLFGLSWGCKLGLEYLLKNEENTKGVKSVTFASPVFSARFFKQDLAYLHEQMGKGIQAKLQEYEAQGDTENEWYKKTKHAFVIKHILGKEESEFPEDIQQALAESAEGHAEDVERAMFGSHADYDKGVFGTYERMEDLKNLTIPVLYTCGVNDEAMPRTVLKYHEATGKNSSIYVYKHSAHMAHLTEPVLYIRRLAHFLQQVESAA